MPAHKSWNTIVLKCNTEWHVNANKHVCFLHLVSCYANVIWSCIVQSPCSPFGTCVGWSDDLCLVSVWVRSDFQYDGFLNITTIAKPVVITLFWDTHTQTHTHTCTHLHIQKEQLLQTSTPASVLMAWIIRHGMSSTHTYALFLLCARLVFMSLWCFQLYICKILTQTNDQESLNKIIKSVNVIFEKLSA